MAKHSPLTLIKTRAILACRAGPFNKWPRQAAIAPSIRITSYNVCYTKLLRWLLDQGIESMSLNPDTVVETWMFLAGETV